MSLPVARVQYVVSVAHPADYCEPEVVAICVTKEEAIAAAAVVKKNIEEFMSSREYQEHMDKPLFYQPVRIAMACTDGPYITEESLSEGGLTLGRKNVVTGL